MARFCGREAYDAYNRLHARVTTAPLDRETRFRRASGLHKDVILRTLLCSLKNKNVLRVNWFTYKGSGPVYIDCQTPTHTEMVCKEGDTIMFTKSALALAIVLVTAAGALAATKVAPQSRGDLVNNPSWDLSRHEQIRRDTFTHD